LASYALNDFVQVKTGIKFQQINEEFDWDGSYTINELGERIEIDPEAETLVAIPFQQQVDRDVVNYNKHQLVSIPVLIGLHKRVNAFSMGINAGPLFNVYTNTSGVQFNADFIPVAIEDNVPSFNIGLEANAEIGYTIKNNTDLIFDLSVQRMTGNDSFLNFSINSLSAGLGLKKNF